MARSQPSAPFSKPRGQGGRNRRRIGRPKEWTPSLVREMLALHICTDLTNDELLFWLRGSTRGTRTLQDLRKQLLGNAVARWRSQNPAQRHRRICHLRAIEKPGSGPRLCSLDTTHVTHSQPAVTACDALSTTCSVIPNSPRSQAYTVVFNLRVARDTRAEFHGTKICVRAKLADTQDSTENKVDCDLETVDHEIFQLCEQIKSACSRNGPGAPSWSLLLSNNDLSATPLLDTHYSLPSLHEHIQRMAMNHCRLFTIPTAVKLFNNLKYLNLQRNRLSEISSLHLPKNIHILDLSHNRLSTISKDLSSLKSLRNLALSHNLIKHLPEWLSRWTSLHLLEVNGNPLEPYSYLAYHKAFQQSENIIDHNSCTPCMSRATSVLKSLVSFSTNPPIDTRTLPLGCTCKRKLQPAVSIPHITLTDDKGETTANEEDILDRSNDIPALQRYLQRTSLLTGSTRSTASIIALESVSSAGSLKHLSRINRQALMLVHCCFREDENERPLCMHLRIVALLASGLEDDLPAQYIHQRDMDGNSALHIAAVFGASPRLLKRWIDQGCHVKALNNDCETFLHRATANDWMIDGPETITLIRHLYTVGFSFLHRDIRGNTIFHTCRRLKLLFASTSLLPNFVQRCRFTRNMEGEMLSDHTSCALESPSMWFGRNRQNRDLIYYKPQHASTLMRAPQHTSSEKQHVTNTCTAECLLKVRSSLHELAHLIATGHNLFVVHDETQPWDCQKVLADILARGGDDVNSYDEKGMTVLMAFVHAFSRRRQLEDEQAEQCIALLVAHGADPRWINRRKDTVLHHAVFFGMPFALQPLIDAGANVNARDGNGVSVMQLLTEAMRRRKFDLKLYASFQQCMVILADNEAQLDPSLAQELRWHEPNPPYEPSQNQWLAVSGA